MMTLPFPGKRKRRKPPSPITIDFVREQLEEDKLDLAYYSLEAAPIEELKCLPQATMLDLSSNHISTLPDDFGILRHLVELNLSKNKLNKLPDNFGQLSNLQWLDLHSNKLTTLPHAFWQLSKLEWLDLRDNQLESELKRVVKESQGKEDCAQKVRHFLQSKARDRERKRHLEQERANEAAMPSLRSTLRDLPKCAAPVKSVNLEPDLDPRAKQKPESEPESEPEPEGFKCPCPCLKQGWCHYLLLASIIQLVTATIVLFCMFGSGRFTPEQCTCAASDQFISQPVSAWSAYPELMRDYLMHFIKTVDSALLLILVVLVMVLVVIAIATLLKLYWYHSRWWSNVLLLMIVVMCPIVLIAYTIFKNLSSSHITTYT